MGRFDLDKPNPLWKHNPKRKNPTYGSRDSDRFIINLHTIEKQLRREIALTQVQLMPNGIMARKLAKEGKR